MAYALKYGDVVYVRLNGRMGTIIGPSENPIHYGADEAVVRVRMQDDGAIVEAGVSSLEKADEGAAATAEAEHVAADEKPPTKSDKK